MAYLVTARTWTKVSIRDVKLLHAQGAVVIFLIRHHVEINSVEGSERNGNINGIRTKMQTNVFRCAVIIVVMEKA